MGLEKGVDNSYVLYMIHNMLSTECAFYSGSKPVLIDAAQAHARETYAAMQQ
jgi:hypothetical protein